MGSCISRCDCSCTRSSSPVLPQQQQQELPQPIIQDKLVILSSSPLPSTYPLADSSSSSPVKPPPPSSPSLSFTPSTCTTNNRSSSISCTSSTLSRVYASPSSASSSSSSTSTYTSSSASSELGRSFSDEFQWSNVRKHPPKPRRTIQPAPSQQQQKAPPEAAAPVLHKKPPPSWHRVAPTNISPCPQLQKSFRKDQRISSSTRTTSERECVGTRVDDVGNARCSSYTCNAKTHNRRPDGGRGGCRPRDSDKRKERNEKVRQKKTESRVHHMMDAAALQDDDQIGSSHRYCPGEDNDNSLVALDCFIFL